MPVATVASVLKLVVNVAVEIVQGAVGVVEFKVKVILPMKSKGGVYVGFKSVALGENVPPGNEAVQIPSVTTLVIELVN